MAGYLDTRARRVRALRLQLEAVSNCRRRLPAVTGTVLYLAYAQPARVRSRRGLRRLPLGVVTICNSVTVRLFPQCSVLEAYGELWVIDESIKEFAPGFGCETSISEHVCQLFDTVIGKRGDGLVGTDVDADDCAAGQIVVVRDDGFQQLYVLAEYPGDIV